MRKRYTVLLLSMIILLFACNNTRQQSESNTCPPPPMGYTKADLAGIWKAGLTERNDTVIIRENGTYKQIVHVQTPAFDYESDWLPWSYEISGNGIPYLHLQEMRLCVYWDGIDCNQVGGGDDNWYDFCKEEWVKMPNEGILMVLGPPPNAKLPPPGIALFALKRSTEGTTVYEWQKPKIK